MWKWRKNEFQKFLPGTIFKIKKRDKYHWRVPLRYYMYPKFRINRIAGLEIVRGGTKTYHTDTRTHSRTRTHTRTRRARARASVQAQAQARKHARTQVRKRTRAHARTQARRHARTHAHTHTPAAHLVSLFFKRNKTKKITSTY